MLLESKEVNKVLLTSDQKIIVIGKTTNDFSIEKLNNDGFYDLTFGNNGITTLDDNNTFEVFTSGQVMNDGSIICVGNSSNSNFQANKVVIAKFSPNGIFDSNFGLKRINMPSIPNTSHFNNYIRDFKFLSDNSMILLVDGSYTDFQGFGHSRIYKADSNGNLITSFGTNGYYQFSNTTLQNMQLLENGKILITLTGSGNHSVSVYLFNTDGSLNTNFGAVSIGLQSDFTNVAKTAIYDNKIFTAYNRTDVRNDYYINSYLIDNQFLAAADFANSLENTIIYPNPFTDKININLKGMDFQKFKISVFNINGSEILSASYEPIDNNPLLSIDELSKYSAGIYFLKIQSDTYSKTFKIIKK